MLFRSGLVDAADWPSDRSAHADRPAVFAVSRARPRMLACFDRPSRDLGVTELAYQMGMSRSTTHRYVVTLARPGFLTQVAGRKYRLTLVCCTGNRAGSAPMPDPAHKLGGQAEPPASPWRAKDRSSVGQSVGGTGEPTLDRLKSS